jgi:cell wall-associated NlpC family hydrolase
MPRAAACLGPLAAAAALAIAAPAFAATAQAVPGGDAALDAYAAQVGASVRWNPDTAQLFVVWSRHAWLVYPLATANLPGETAANTKVGAPPAAGQGPALYLPLAVLQADMPPAPQPQAATATPTPARDAVVARLTAILRGALGDPYVWGGTSPSGFDCSGLMQWAFAQVGVSLPRTSFEQFEAGTPAATPAPGDLVFFQTYAPGASHVGMYVGDGEFIDVGLQAVQAEDLSAPYWSSRYLGARDVLG